MVYLGHTMPISSKNLAKAVKLIGAKHARFIALQAKKQDRLESQWRDRFQAEVDSVHEKAMQIDRDWET